MSEHEHFEELCALIVSGLASEVEYRELETHLLSCEECRARVADFTQLGAGILSAKSRRGKVYRPPLGMTDRFVERAIAEGIPLRKLIRVVPAWASRRPLVLSGAFAVAVLFVLAVATSSLWKTSPFGRPAQSKAVAIKAASPLPAAGTTVEASSADRDELKRLRAEIEAVTAHKQRLAVAVTGLTQQLSAETSRERDLVLRLAAAQGQRDQLRRESSAKEARIADLGSQLNQHQTQSADTIAALAQNQIEIRDLRDQLAQQTAVVRQQKEMLAAGSQARDLIIARNLHIIDVHDNNGSGERQQAFGRIFYTEGKSIVFYAYDLDSATKLKKQVAFYVWGGKLGDEKTARNLGIFRSEDAGAGRWVLTFDDPRVLAQINTVFVTAESKNVERPDGKRILFAFLEPKPNHP
jgi:hypothetical protein